MLKYYNETNNFGDLLNPLIFNHYLTGFFDDDPETIFLGIGTLLGLEKGTPITKKIIVFSSGYGHGDTFTYGTAPVIDERYDVMCVRGPLTAKVLGLNPSFALSDGALLLNHMNFQERKKRHAYSYIPHHVSEGMFDGWPEITEAAGLHFISPHENVLSIIEQIQESEVVITEAMHGAIIADIFRVPWIPVKAYSHINEFKWQDWALTLNLKVEFHPLGSLFNKRLIKAMIRNAMPHTWQKPLTAMAALIYKINHDRQRKRQVIRELKNAKAVRPFLSKRQLLNDKSSQLLDKIELLKHKDQPV